MDSPDFVRPDVVWGVITEPAHLPGAVAARNIAAKLGVPWVFELRDPCPHPGGRLTRLEEQAFRSCLESCAAVVTTTQALADDLCRQYPCCRGKTHAIRHCYDDREPPNPAPRPIGAPLRLLHAGTLYGGTGRSAVGLVRALHRAMDLAPEARGQIRLDLLGGGRGANDSVRTARSLGLTDVVSALPQVPKADAIRAMDEADVLVVIKFADPRYNMQIPGKTFQYLGRGKPVLGVMGECEAGDIIRRSGLGVVVAPDDIDGIAQQLLAYWRGRLSLQDAYRPDWGYISEFSRSSFTRHINDLLDSIVPPPSAAGCS